MLIDRFDYLRIAIKQVQKKYPFVVEAVVILPDHLHTIWTLPPDDDDYASRWMLVKAGFSRHHPKGERISASRAKKGERGIWQRRYWEHLLRNGDDCPTY